MIRGILLAGGSGTRFGGAKLLAAFPNDPVPIGVRSARSLVAGLGNALAVVRAGDAALARALRDAGCEVLESADFAGQPVARVALCRLEGVGATLVAVVTPDGEPDGPRVYPLSSIRSWWRRWSRRRALLLNVDVETVDFARRRAASDPALAGHLLARSLLLRGGDSIPVSANEKLLARAGGGAR